MSGVAIRGIGLAAVQFRVAEDTLKEDLAESRRSPGAFAEIALTSRGCVRLSLVPFIDKRAPPCANLRLSLTCNHMVVRPDLSAADLDRIFHALADTTRRDIITRLLGGETTSVSGIASRYDMSFAAVQKHVAVLEEAGLVTKHPQGREKLVRGNPERLARARQLLQSLEHLWASRFRQLDALLAEPRPPKE